MGRLLLYSFLKEHLDCRPIPGIGQNPIQFYSYREVTVAYGANTPNFSSIDPKQSLTLHPAVLFQRAVDAIHRNSSSVPIKLGVLVDGLEAIEDLVERNYLEILSLLDALDGCEEYTFSFTIAPRKEMLGVSFLNNLNSPAAGYLRKKHQQYSLEQQKKKSVDLIRKVLIDHFGKWLKEVAVQEGNERAKIHLLLYKSCPRKVIRSACVKEALKDCFQLSISGPHAPFYFSHVKLSQ